MTKNYNKLLYTVKQYQMIRNEPLKKPLPLNLPIKPKSTYAKQYDDFNKRLSRNWMRSKLPTLQMRNKNES